MQKGNAPEERKLQRLFRNAEAARLIKRCNDFGAGGVSVAIGELADGLEIDLNRVPRKYDGLDGTELAISESQERMAVVRRARRMRTRSSRWPAAENLEATDGGRGHGGAAAGDALERPQRSWISRREFLNSNGAPKIAQRQMCQKPTHASVKSRPKSVRARTGSRPGRRISTSVLPARSGRAVRLHHRRGQRC